MQHTYLGLIRHVIGGPRVAAKVQHQGDIVPLKLWRLVLVLDLAAAAVTRGGGAHAAVQAILRADQEPEGHALDVKVLKGDLALGLGIERNDVALRGAPHEVPDVLARGGGGEVEREGVAEELLALPVQHLGADGVLRLGIHVARDLVRKDDIGRLDCGQRAIWCKLRGRK